MSTSNERLNTAQWVLERHLAWIAAADVKVGVIVTINVAMLGGLAGVFGWADASKTNWAYLLSVLAGLLVAGGIFCAAMAMFPRTRGPLKSLLFFGPVAKQNSLDYQAAFLGASDDELLQDWTHQIHRNAEIACEKFRWVWLAMIWSFLGVPAWVFAIAVLMNK